MKFALIRKDGALDILIRLFKVWSFVFAVVVLPIYVTYKLDSFLLVMKPFEILVNAAAALLIFTLLSAVCTLLSWVATIILWPWRIRALQANVFIALLLALYEIFKSVKLWFQSVFGFALNIPSVYKGLLVVAALAAIVLFQTRFKRLNIYVKIEQTIFGFFRPVLAVCLASLLLTLSWMAVHYEKSDCAPCNGFPTPASSVHSKSEKSSREKPNVILLTFDALSAEDMSVYGYSHLTTPNIDALANDNYVFDNMYANSNWTRTSLASVLTGLYPSSHRLMHVLYGDMFLKDETKTLPWILRKSGFSTSAVVNNHNYAHPYANGTFRSFESCPWVTSPHVLKPGRNPAALIPFYGAWLCTFGLEAHLWLYDWAIPLFKYLPSSKVIQDECPYPIDYTMNIAKRLLAADSSRKFLWIHLMVPHSPFMPPAPFKHSLIKDESFATASSQDGRINKKYPKSKQSSIDKLRLRYDEYIRYGDYEVGRFIQSLKDSGEWDKTIFILSSDHGESFEDGFVGHGGALLNDQFIHVPLIVHLPGMQGGKRIRCNAEQVDIAPTILDLLGMEIPGWMEGESLRGAMLGEYASAKPKFSMQLEANSRFGPLRTGTVAEMEGEYKLILDVATGKAELYHLARDRQEDEDLSSKDAERTERMKREIIEKIR